MEEIWTYGTWVVQPGNEDAFIAAWYDLAQWTSQSFLPGASAHLLRDAENPQVFTSLGGWPDAETIDRWRESEGFREHISRIVTLVASFEPHTGYVVAEV